ncbi:MAG: ATP-binding cassette, subfamily bacterial [Actinomycetota bacterium]|nr:ATP-binding cassette, subfamily bacterial [Actinomycetota bacterium]
MAATPRGVDDDTLRRGLRSLGTALRMEPRIFAIAVAGSAVYGTTTVGSAWVFGRVTDGLVVPAFRAGHTTTGALAAAALAIIGVAVLKAAGIVARRLGAGVMQYRLQATYRQQVTRQYLRLPLSWHQRHPTGELLSNANADVEATWYPIAPLPMAVGVLVMLFVAGIALLLTDLVLALVGFLVFPAIFVLNVIYQRRLSPLATRAQQLRAQVSSVAHESFEGALVVKTLGREPEETDRFRAAAHELRDAQIAVGRVRGMFDPALEALPSLGVLAVLLIGSRRIESGAIDPGDLVQVAYLFTLLAFPVRAIGWVLGELPRSVVGWERVSRVLDATGGLEFGAVTLPPSGAASLGVQSVSFAYDEGDVLHAVSFDVEPGSTVAVVGPTGSGKSTLTTLLVRLVDPGSGVVVLDGADLRAVAAGGVAGAAAVVPQQTFLFDDTVRGNVSLGRDVDDDQVWEALRVAQADGFVGALPGGLDTRIGERGMSLSGGQRQRLALARAIVSRPRLLVMDDATSSVDARVEAAILAGLREHAAGAVPPTVVVVAYRKATIALADEVVYVEHGRVVDRGSHEELLDRCAGYRELVTAYEREEEVRRAVTESG